MEGQYFGWVFGILSMVHERRQKVRCYALELRTYFQIAVPHSLLVQTPKPSTVEKIVDVASVDAELDLYIAANTERWHLDTSWDDMFFHFGNKLGSKTSGKTLRVDASTLGRA
jgi:hypothetical protein